MKLERIVADLVEKTERRFYGKYRGIVVNNQDPMTIGRLKVRIPSVLGDSVVSGWATPCAPFGGAADQGFLFIPDVGAGVWMEFEEGDLEFPIWAGTYWSQPGSESEMPKPNQGSDGSEQSSVQNPPTSKIIKTAKGHTVQMEDADGAETILIREGAKGHFITMDKNGITVKDAQSNTIQFNGNGITIQDKNNNVVQMTSSGISITDATGNAIAMSSSAFTLTAKVPFKIDASGQTVTITGSAIDFEQG
jgi:uncharacterized protein involved in type VI secretion and phage assembly